MSGHNCGQHRTHSAQCPACKRAHTHYDRRRRRLMKNGSWLYTASNSHVIPHITELRAAGMSLNQIARIAGVAPRTVQAVVRHPDRTIQGRTAAAILAVQPTRKVPHGMTPAVGTTRRLRALVAAGYTLTELARHLNKSVHTVWEWTWAKQSTVTVGTHTAVCDLYDCLSLIPGSSGRARNAGVRNGWALPLAWDDDALDDPDGKPCDASGDRAEQVVDMEAVRRALAGERVPLTSVEQHYAVHHGLRSGMTATAISRAVHLSGDKTKKLADRPLPAYELAA